MLLVTTADEATWGRDEEILFLGEWCLVAGREQSLAGRRYKLLSYHWDDRDKLQRDAVMLARRFEEILPRLAEQLNAVHGTRHDLRYWRLVTGPWLLWMLTIVWDRLEGLRRAAAMGPLQARVYEEDAPPPLDFAAMGDLAARDDGWNQALCTRLLRSLPGIACLELPRRAAIARLAPPPKRIWVEPLKSLLRGAAGLLRPRVAMVNMHIPPAMQVKLQLGLWQVPLLLSAPPVPSFSADAAMRQKLAVDCGADEFGILMGGIIRETFPAVCLEGYLEARELAMRAFPRSPRAVVTANAYTNELFCLWAAEQRAPLVITQHGGHYGVDRIETMEDHELAVADLYCSWGWLRPGYDNIRPLPALKVRHGMDMPQQGGRHGLVAVYDAAHRYPYRLYGIPIGGQRRQDNARQIELLEALPSFIRGQLRLRCHPLNDGYGFRRDLEARGFGGQFDQMRGMLPAVKSARLCLVGSNSTPLLEALCSGTPTLAFYDQAFAEERAEAVPYFDALRQAGILHTDPRACADKIAQVWDDPEGWWKSDIVQDATRKFTDRFAGAPPGWLKDWRTFLRSVG